MANTEPLRIAFYKSTATFLRAYSAISLELENAGYTLGQAQAIRDEVQLATEMRGAIKVLSGEELDVKPYEGDMRHLINTYIQADPADPMGEMDAYSLVDLIVKTGIHDAIAKKLNQKGTLSRNAVAEGIINNVRKTIIRDRLTDPRFYERMSKLLEDLIAQQREDAEAYEAFLRNAEALVKQMAGQGPADAQPVVLTGHPEAARLYNNLPSVSTDTFQCPPGNPERAALAMEIDLAMREHAPAGWRGDPTREAQVRNALFPLLGRDRTATAAVFEIVKNQAGY
jgi:type I restriction enzyme R subunit